MPGAVASLGGAERALRQAALRRPAGAGHRHRRARLRGAGGGAAEVDAGRAGGRAGVAARLRADLPAARPRAARSASCSACRRRRARCARSPQTKGAGASTAARSPKAWRAARASRAGRTRWPTSPPTSPSGSTPIAKDYRGHTLHEIPPNGQGIAALMALGILQHFDLASLPVDGTASLHLQIEAMKLAFADVYRYVSERVDDGGHARAAARRRLPGQPRQADRPEARAGLRRRQPGQGRHHLPDRRRRERHDGQLHPEQLHGLRLGRGRARLGPEPAEPRPRLQPDAPAARTSWRRASGPSTPSSRPS